MSFAVMLSDGGAVICDDTTRAGNTIRMQWPTSLASAAEVFDAVDEALGFALGDIAGTALMLGGPEPDADYGLSHYADWLQFIEALREHPEIGFALISTSELVDHWCRAVQYSADAGIVITARLESVTDYAALMKATGTDEVKGFAEDDLAQFGLT